MSTQSEALLTAENISVERSDYANGELWARAVIVLGWREVFGSNPTLRGAQFAQAVARGESGYGKGWKGEGVGSHNWGAVQAGRLPCDPETAFEYQDAHYDAAGNRHVYSICFRKYESDVAGAAGFIKIAFRASATRATANAGDIAGFSDALRVVYRFELPRDQHIAALTRNLKEITSALGESMPAGSSIGSDNGGLLIVGALGVLGIGAYALMKRGKLR